MFKKDNLLYLWILVPVVLIALLLQIYKVEPFQSFSLRFNDVNFALQEKEISDDIVFVAIDEPSVNSYGRWPWKREVIANGLDKLNQADVVLLDIIFSEPTSEEQDSILIDSLSSLNSSVCGFFLRSKSTQVVGEDELEILGDSSLDMLQSQISQHSNPNFVHAPHAEINIYPVLEACTLSGSFSTLSASDHLFRSYPIAVYYKDFLYPSLAVQGLRVRNNKDIERTDEKQVKLYDKTIDLDANGFVRLNYYDLSKYDVVSFLDVTEGKIKPEYFKNKIVILGITEIGAGDIVSTPVGSIPGPLLHYTFLSNFLENHLIVEPKNISSYLVLLFVLLPFFLVLMLSKALYRVVINIFAYLIVYMFVRYLFISEMLYIDLFFPLISLLLSFFVVESTAFNQQEKKGKFLKDSFSSYLSGDLLDKLIANPDSLKLGGEKKELSILFSDIRGFTTISESMSPEKLIEILNRYFTPMTTSVLDNGGMLDKYIGDAVMAFFNAPVDVVKHADAACYSALRMIEELDSLNEVFRSEGLIPIKIGIGVNTAEVIVGNIGSDAKKEYTVIGDGVNLASRVEGLTKNYTVQIIITEFTVAKLQDDFVYREIEQVKVKGKDEAVLLFELMPQKDKELKLEYDKALKLYKDGDFKEAKLGFMELVQKHDDGPSKNLLERIEDGESWGVLTMTTK